MKMTIRKKLLSGFLILAILLGIVCSISYYQIQKINHSYSNIVEQHMANLANIKDIQLYASREISSLRGILIKDEGSIDFLQTSMEQINETVANMLKTNQSQEVNELLQTIISLNEQLKKQSENISNSTGNYSDQDIKLVDKEIINTAVQIETAANQIGEIQGQEMEKEIQANSQIVTSVKIMNLVYGIISFIAAILIGVFMTRIITRPILLLVEGAKKIAAGDLTHNDIQLKNRDEIGDLSQAFNQMKHSLHNLIDHVRSNSEQLAATSDEFSASVEENNRATEQITIAMQEIVVGAEKQVSNVIQSVESTEEISKSMNKAADSIQSVANLTVAANEKAILGNDVVIRTIEQMSRVQHSAMESAQVVHILSEKAKEIGQIIGLITQIADQTNLLALNAAIEAARAGAQGKGFAVVAGEVRKLAEQSSNAAGQINHLIGEIQNESEKAVHSMNNGTIVVEEGLKLVSQTGDSFQDISQSIKQVTIESQEVASLVKQVQLNSLKVAEGMKATRNIVEQSSSNIQCVVASTEEQSSSMEDVSSSAEVLREMAQDLHTAINRFKA